MKGVEKKGSTSNKVMDYIKRKIVNNELKVGDRIPGEIELAQTLQVSRSTVREAMKMLEALKVIVIRRGDGTYISNPDQIHAIDAVIFKFLLQDITLQEVCEFRKEMEFAIMHCAVQKITAEELELLKRNIQRMDYVLHEMPEKFDLMYALDMEFHHLIGQATHNVLMQEINHLVFSIVSPTMYRNYEKGLVDDSTVASHWEIYYALSKKDVFAIWSSLLPNIKLWQESYRRENEYCCKEDSVFNPWLLASYSLEDYRELLKEAYGEEDRFI